MTKNTTKARKCEAITKAGKPCKCNAVEGSLFCATHGKDPDVMSSLPVYDQRKAAAVALNLAMNKQGKAEEAIDDYALRLSTRFQWIGHKLEEIGWVKTVPHWTDAKGLEYRIREAGGVGDNVKPIVDQIAKAYKEEQKAATELWKSTRKGDSNANRLFYLVRKASLAQFAATQPKLPEPSADEKRAEIDAIVKRKIRSVAKAVYDLTVNEHCSDDAVAVYEELAKVASKVGIDTAEFDKAE